MKIEYVLIKPEMNLKLQCLGPDKIFFLNKKGKKKKKEFLQLFFFKVLYRLHVHLGFFLVFMLP